ncbi:FAD-dependent oxidoreductase [Bacillus sp. JJ1533]|uniref:NAD(P)/FAD-dependent oxidoreductase n=1 Tax=Bacillus sp. JJ1533 TaxID=3122959 RepID=UPI002FFFEAFE
MAKIVIIGGGIIGLSSAYYLSKHNHDITIIDKGTIGGGCSEGNMGWICPSLSDPVPGPGVIGSGIKWMFKKGSPLYLKPTLIPKLAPWLIGFIKNCNVNNFTKGLNASLDLGLNSIELYEELLEEGVSFEYHHKGLLMVFKDEKEAKLKYEKMQKARNIGQPMPLFLNHEQLLQEEPLLNESVKAGILMPGERHVRPESLTKGLEKFLKNKGVTIIENERVLGFDVNNGVVKRVHLKNEQIPTDICLVAAGVESVGLLKEGFNKKIPMISGKGYSITIESEEYAFQHALYFGDTRVGLTPFNNEFRVGGAMDLTGIDKSLNQERLSTIKKSAEDYLRIKLDNEKVKKQWAGMRPMTTDGLPVLGPIPKVKNAYIAAGHAMMGISMGLSTGKLISQIVEKDDLDIDITPFSLERFA